MGAAAGNIMAAIITTQIARNSGARSPIVGDAIAMSIAGSEACQASSAQPAADRARSRPNMALRWAASGPVGTRSMAVSRVGAWLARHGPGTRRALRRASTR
jgi:hypothetical protein